MKEKHWEMLGFWGVALLMLIATMIVIRWIVDFVTWSALDSGWAQVLGSLAALAVAIYVMSRQNRHAVKILIDTDRLAYRRRTAAVKALVERAETVAAKSGDAVIKTFDMTDPDQIHVSLNAAQRAIDNIRESIKEIPTYELGSFDMAEGIHLLASNLETLSNTIKLMIQYPAHQRSELGLHTLRTCLTYIGTSKAQFDKGAKEFS